MKQLTYCVRGQVQRVYFRNETVAKAKSLGISGWVQNNLDGTVGGEAVGDEGKLNEL
jgi:acylphosphatase